MNRICPNCGRPMDEYDPICGPGGMGCLYCTKHCPNCHREVFDQDIIYGNSREYCRYCRAEVEEEEKQILEDDIDDDDDIDLGDGLENIDEETLNKFRNMTKEERREYIDSLYADIISKLKK